MYVQQGITAISSSLAAAATANTTYVVSLEAASRYDGAAPSGSASAQLYVGTTLLGTIALDNATLLAHRGELVTFSGSFTTGATVPTGAVTLRIVNSSGVQLQVDDVSVVASVGSQQDRLDLTGLLQGETGSAGDLVNYLHFVHSGNDTIVDVSTTGQFAGGVFDASKVDHVITLKNVDLTTAGSSDTAIIQNLLEYGKLVTDGVLSGTPGANTLVGSVSGNNTLYGDAGSDVLSSSGNGNTLVGGAGNDTLQAAVDGSGDTLIGGQGNDLMTAGGTAETFMWHLGDGGTVGSPAVDTIVGFTSDNTTTFGQGADRLDLRDLLVGEAHIGLDVGNLAKYLHFDYADGNTTVHVSSSGAFTGSNYGVAENQQIVLQGVNLTALGSDTAIIQDLLSKGKLITD